MQLSLWLQRVNALSTPTEAFAISLGWIIGDDVYAIIDTRLFDVRYQ